MFNFMNAMRSRLFLPKRHNRRSLVLLRAARSDAVLPPRRRGSRKGLAQRLVIPVDRSYTKEQRVVFSSKGSSMQYWLFKTEPGCFSLDDLIFSPDATTSWDGVRNYQARNLMRSM